MGFDFQTFSKNFSRHNVDPKYILGVNLVKIAVVKTLEATDKQTYIQTFSKDRFF